MVRCFTEDILFSAQSRFEVQFLRKETVKGIKEELSFIASCGIAGNL